jgi:quercetin dioxygenase-like cupin family protein
MTDKTITDYTVIADLFDLLGSIQTDSIISRTFYKGDKLKAVLFGFDAGQALSEHTSTQAAMIQIIRGEATVTLGSDTHELSAGSWLYMEPGLKHSIFARTPLVMLLFMLSRD